MATLGSWPCWVTPESLLGGKEQRRDGPQWQWVSSTLCPEWAQSRGDPCWITWLQKGFGMWHWKLPPSPPPFKPAPSFLHPVPLPSQLSLPQSGLQAAGVPVVLPTRVPIEVVWFHGRTLQHVHNTFSWQYIRRCVQGLHWAHYPVQFRHLSPFGFEHIQQ